MRCSSPGVPGTAHGRTSRSSRWYGWNGATPAAVGCGPGSAAVRPGRAAATARRRTPARRRTAAAPASCGRPPAAPPRRPWRSSRPATAPPARPRGIRRDGRTTPETGPLAPSWSAGRGSGPPRCTSITTTGSSAITARPIASDFDDRPGPLVAVTPRPPPKAAPTAAPIAATSSSAWNVRTPKRFSSAKSVQHVGGRRDRVGGVQQRQAGRARRRDQAQGQRLVAGDAAVAAWRQRRPRHAHAGPAAPRWFRRSGSRPGGRGGWPPGRPDCGRICPRSSAASAPAAARTASRRGPGRRSSCSDPPRAGSAAAAAPAGGRRRPRG